MLKTLLKKFTSRTPLLKRKDTLPLLHYYIFKLLHWYDSYKLLNQLPPVSSLKTPPNFSFITLLLSYIIILSADCITLPTPPTPWSCIKLPTNYYIITLLCLNTYLRKCTPRPTASSVNIGILYNSTILLLTPMIWYHGDILPPTRIWSIRFIL